MLSTPGRSTKQKCSKGRPMDSSSNRVVKIIRSTAAKPLFPDNCRPLHLSAPSDLLCCMCNQVIERPIDIECGSTVCAPCLISWVENRDLLKCPCCESTSLERHLKKTSTCVVTLLNGLLVRCPRGCRMLVKAENFFSHLESSECKDFYISSADSPSRLTVREMLMRSAEHPVTNSEKKVAENLIKRMMAEKPNDSILRIPTRGQVCYMYTKPKSSFSIP